MGALVPLAVILGVLATGALIALLFWSALVERFHAFTKSQVVDLELAGLRTTPERYTLTAFGLGGGAWIVLALFLKAGIALSLTLFALCMGLTFYFMRWWLRRLRRRRIALFQEELEQALRTLSGGVRVGLGIRQAFVMTAEQSPNPIKMEFTRVVGLNNVGVSILDAFDQMAARMTNPETAMLARVLRVQSQSGGDLGGVLAGLANTIRDRRKLLRRVSAITAQGRATGWLLGLMPVALGLFLIVAEPSLREAMLFTLLGRVFLAIALGLDALSIFFIMKIVQIDP